MTPESSGSKKRIQLRGAVGLTKSWGWRTGALSRGSSGSQGSDRPRDGQRDPEGPVLRRESLGFRKLEKSSVGGPRRRGRYQPPWRWGKGGSPGAGGFFLHRSLTPRPRPRRKCPERRCSRPIAAGLGDAWERAERARGRKGRAGPAPLSCGRHLSRPHPRLVVGEAGQGSRTDPSPQHTRVCKVNFSLSWRGRGEPRSSPPQVAGAVPGPLRKGALPPGLHPAPTARERMGNWVSGPVGSLGSASLSPDSQLCSFHHPAEEVLPSTPRPFHRWEDRSTQLGRGHGLRFVSSNLVQGAWSEPGLGHLFCSQAEGG